MTKAVIRGGLVLAVAQLSWHASNFLFNAVCARTLGPSDYGTLATLVALLYVGSPLLIAAQTVMSRLTSQHASDLGTVRWLLRRMSLRGGAIAVVAVAAGVAISAPVSSFLRLPSWKPLALLVLAFGIALFAHLQRGVFQGSGRFGRFAVSSIVEAVAKIVGAAVLVLFVSRSENAAVASIGVASLTAVLVGVYLARFLPDAHRTEPPRHIFRYSLTTVTTLVLLSGLFSMDVVGAKHYLSPHDAGVYASVALLGKVAFFGTSAVSLFSFPFFSARHDARRDSRREFGFSLGIIVAIGLTVAAVYRAAPALVVRPAVGHQYASGEKYVALMALAITLYAVAYQTAMYLLSQHSARALFVLGAAQACQLALLYTVHNSIRQIVFIQLGVLGSVAVALVALAVRRAPAPAREVAPALAAL